MEFQFDENQEYQLEAIASIVRLFDGQPYIDAGKDVALGTRIIGNRLELDHDALLQNLWTVQDNNGFEDWDEALEITPNSVSKNGDAVDLPYYNFSVEMETGTGKTYVYLRTALELYLHYGFRKFIIVVPSVAIREGVLKTLEVTKSHFDTIYKNPGHSFAVYYSKNLTQVKSFAEGRNLEFMVMTIDSFNTDLNVINRPTESLNGEIPIQLIQQVRPILILDEPQTKMEGEKNVQALGQLCPLLTLRYSATHHKPYNQVYRLSPAEAYRQHLVKRVRVYGVTQEQDLNRAFIELVKVTIKGFKIRATLNVHKRISPKSGNVRVKSVTVKPQDDLYEKTALPEYQGYKIDRIESGRVVVLAGAHPIQLVEQESVGEDKDTIYASQIRATIEEHFSRHNDLKGAGIKVLSLFFIDRVENYEAKFKKVFDDAYIELSQLQQNAEWQNYCPEDVRAAYFAKKPNGDLDDSDSGTAEKDRRAYELIMRDKEQLLSFDQPVAFIFSHSALNEGWDNPNIFQICTLRDVKSRTTKRQQIGRGVRLPVNQAGDRIKDEHINKLTVIANESYKQFVATYQEEIDKFSTRSDEAPIPEDVRQLKTVRRIDGIQLDPDFNMLWEKIKHKTRYSVVIDTERITKDIVASVRDIEITAPSVGGTLADIVLDDDDRFREVDLSGRRHFSRVSQRAKLPFLVDRIAHSLATQYPRLALSRRTIFSIIQKSGKLQEGMADPSKFAAKVASVVREKLGDSLVNGIQYIRVDDWYEMSLFKEDFESSARNLLSVRRSVYDYVVCDSNVESDFARYLEGRGDVRLYLKLPSKFEVQTPVGSYNPDWAIVLDGLNGEKCYLVRETKGGEDLRRIEERKTQYANKHFDALGVSYEVITPDKFKLLSC